MSDSSSNESTSEEVLPKGWARVDLGEVLTLKRGYDLPKRKREQGSFPIFAANGTVGTHSVSMVKAPGVVTGRSGTIGRVHFVDEDFWPLNTALYVQDFRGNDPKFIAWLLRKTDLLQFSSSTAVPTLNRNIVHKSKTDLPPLAEQSRIVSAIESLQERSSRARVLLSEVGPLIGQLRQSVLRVCLQRPVDCQRMASLQSRRRASQRTPSPHPHRAKRALASRAAREVRSQRQTAPKKLAGQVQGT